MPVGARKLWGGFNLSFWGGNDFHEATVLERSVWKVCCLAGADYIVILILLSVPHPSCFVDHRLPREQLTNLLVD